MNTSVNEDKCAEIKIELIMSCVLVSNVASQASGLNLSSVHVGAGASSHSPNPCTFTGDRRSECEGP